jgi:hypothetical protein
VPPPGCKEYSARGGSAGFTAKSVPENCATEAVLVSGGTASLRSNSGQNMPSRPLE